MINLIIVLSFFCKILSLNAQEFGEININILAAQLPYADQNIDLIYHKRKIWYRNPENNEMLFSKGFDAAYPFFAKSALVKENGKYGVIDSKGDFLVPPIYKKAEVAPFDHESHIVILDDTKVFNLRTGEESKSYLLDEEPAQQKSMTYIGENNKYGIKKNNATQTSAIYDDILVEAPNFIIAVKNGKIGAIDIHGDCLIQFIYEDAVFSTSMYTGTPNPIFGLKKDGAWDYFRNGRYLFNSTYKCIHFETLLPNSIGVFNKNGKQNILFEDGGTLNKYYDFISENGLLGVRKKKLYLLKKDRTEQLYYRKKS